MDWTAKLLDWIKLSPRYLFPISSATGFVLFAKQSYLDLIGLTFIRDKYLPWIGGVFLISTVLLLSHLLLDFLSWAKRKLSLPFALRRSKSRLRSLTDDERQILKGYIGPGTRTQYFDLENGVVRELERHYIIYRASNIGRLDEWAYNIQPWAWRYLNKHPDLLFTHPELKQLRQVNKHIK